VGRDGADLDGRRQGVRPIDARAARAQQAHAQLAAERGRALLRRESVRRSRAVAAPQVDGREEALEEQVDAAGLVARADAQADVGGARAARDEIQVDAARLDRRACERETARQ
jgi:hypothetical protein